MTTRAPRAAGAALLLALLGGCATQAPPPPADRPVESPVPNAVLRFERSGKLLAQTPIVLRPGQPGSFSATLPGGPAERPEGCETTDASVTWDQSASDGSIAMSVDLDVTVAALPGQALTAMDPALYKSLYEGKNKHRQGGRGAKGAKGKPALCLTREEANEIAFFKRVPETIKAESISSRSTLPAEGGLHNAGGGFNARVVILPPPVAPAPNPAPVKR